ncbi:matrix metalloproteinase-9-like [Argopecten irradians]|uniref:matrix metalloproteinase-9-like n=1 Tax=Argopecten irradians TaxID=31199 RepID=UPI00371DF132
MYFLANPYCLLGGPPSRPTATTLRPTTTTPRPTTTTPRPTTTTPRPTLPPIFVPPYLLANRFQCQRRFDAAFKDDNGTLFMLRLNKLYRIPVYDPATGHFNGIQKSTTVFPGIPWFPDAAFHVLGSTYVILGRKMQQFSGGKEIQELELRGFQEDDSEITAAVALDKNNVLLFVTSQNVGVVWKYDLSNFSVVKNSMKPMTDAFPGIPPIVDMALSRDPSEIIFVSDKEYYRYDVQSKKSAGPYDFHPAFVGGGETCYITEACRRRQEATHPTRSHYTDNGQTSRPTPCMLSASTISSRNFYRLWRVSAKGQNPEPTSTEGQKARRCQGRR